MDLLKSCYVEKKKKEDKGQFSLLIWSYHGQKIKEMKTKNQKYHFLETRRMKNEELKEGSELNTQANHVMLYIDFN